MPASSRTTARPRSSGLVGHTTHKVDEHVAVAVADIEALARVYLAVLEVYFGVT